MPREIKKLELYIHIPFCKQKCKYCDFLSSNKHFDDSEISSYIDKLKEEIYYWSKKVKNDSKVNYKVSSIFIGGGTPSILGRQNIKKIMETIKASFKLLEDVEVTIEVNPESVTLLKAKEYKQAGINRVSIGLQSANNEELKELGRIHTFETFKDALFFLNIAGINNINVDLMYGIPIQTLDSWEATLNTLVKEKINHISAYSLIIEEGTPFFDKKEELLEKLPNEDTIIEMGKTCEDILSKNGFRRYEISNYAKPGKECKHNLGYWNLEEYIGIGLGASSYFKGERFKNTTDFLRYIGCNNFSDIREIERESSRNRDIEEFVFLGLRKSDGISVEEFFNRFGENIKSIYEKQLNKYLGLGMLKENEGRIFFSKKGMNISNEILSEFLVD